MDKLKKTANELLSLAGVEINGTNPWDIQVHNDNFYHRVLSGGSLGLGESYMDAWWDCEELDEFFYRIIRADLERKVRMNWRLLLKALAARVFNLQSRRRAYQVGEKHYDLGNDLFKNMLDERLVYSCAYWKNARSLDEAQENKLDLICQKIGLKPGMRVLDVGCGWASFAKYAAEKYGTEVVGITVSKEQVELGKEMCMGLPVQIRLQDYRDINETFDHVVSVGMFEHVGYKNYRTFMKFVHKCLKDDGLLLLHTIGFNISVKTPEPWTNKYIFPNGLLPSIKQIAASIEGLFVMEDWHNFSADYDRTLMAWHRNFERNWDKIKSNYGERFYRMWKYFLLSSAGAFRARKNQLWQVVLSKRGMSGGYTSIR
ncbi:MAG: cyclopropane fatty acyl phospholipid synthase [candidate division WOR-3 bacterium]|nr:MAG: cyclopropane fatty acyl phospholipid synthase [candidate division WOR-3 bacterium]